VGDGEKREEGVGEKGMSRRRKRGREETRVGEGRRPRRYTRIRELKVAAGEKKRSENRGGRKKKDNQGQGGKRQKAGAEGIMNALG